MYKVLLVLFTWFLFSYPRSAAAGVRTGAEILADSGFAELAGKRVGLVTNHTAMAGGRHLIDLLADSGKVTLAALFAPEHGLRGLQEDGVAIAEGRDERTGVKIFSLYGKDKKPTPEMLKNVDILLFDIQDIGARFYTYISTMGLAMRAAAEAGIPFVVLDRPNPLGGLYVGGPVLEKRFSSFVGLYPIPVAHGLTSGELALMIKGEGMLEGLAGLDVRVVRMAGWQREMQWPDTGLPWIRTSPNIPDFETSLLYPGLCFIEATAVSEARGTTEPFKMSGIPRLDSTAVAAALNGKGLPGVKFEPVSFTPRSLPGMSSRPKFSGTAVNGVRLVVTDRRLFQPVETGVYLLEVMHASTAVNKEKFFQLPGFDLLAGTDRLRLSLKDKTPAGEIVASWRSGLVKFGEMRRNYLLY